MADKEYIEREATLKLLQSLGSRDYRREKGTICDAIKMIMHPHYTPAADVVEVDKVAELLDEMFGNEPPCNFNDYDELMGELCKCVGYCPSGGSKKAWGLFVRYKMDGKGDA